jgi:hypothetical protein
VGRYDPFTNPICAQVHVGTPIQTCRDENVKRHRKESEVEAYAEEDFENLIDRYEEPNGMNRWDSPLFTVVYDDQFPPFDQIWDALFGSNGESKIVRPNLATVKVSALSLTFKVVTYPRGMGANPNGECRCHRARRTTFMSWIRRHLRLSQSFLIGRRITLKKAVVKFRSPTLRFLFTYHRHHALYQSSSG